MNTYALNFIEHQEAKNTQQMSNPNWRINKTVLSSKLETEFILLSIDAGYYFGLDSVASRIWELLSEKPYTVDELADHLLEEYEVDRQTCLEDVQAFIDDMAFRKLITPSE